MLLTDNYKLKKPEGTDVVNVDDFNGNSDIIDEKLFAVEKASKDFFNKGGTIGGEVIFKKDIWLSGFSKTTNGYTKLPNGLILQWGRIVRTGDSAKAWEIFLVFPIEFPTACWTVVGNVSSQDTHTNARIAAGYVIPYTKKQFKTRGGGIGLPYENTVATTEINWFAIGS